jgi:hypothetical protein
MLFVEAVTVHAVTYYVATTGNDAYSGSQVQPFRTIKRGLSALRAGDTLYLRGGTYAEAIDSNVQTIPTGTTWADAPIISSYPGETATLQVSGGEAVINLPHGYIQYLTFQNLVLNGNDRTNLIISIGYSGAHHIQFKNIEAMHSGHHIAQIQGHHHIVTGGKFHHAGNEALYPAPLMHYGFYVTASDSLFENFEIYNIDDYAIHNGVQDPPYGDRNTYRNLLIHDVAYRTSGKGAIAIWRGDSHLVYNCIVYNSRGSGISAQSGVTNTRIYNNTLYGNTLSGITVGLYGATNTVVKNNISYGNGGSQIVDTGTGTVLTNNLTTDPQVVDPTTKNFRLRSNSPAIDRGATVGEVTQDFDKIARPQGFSIDIGAFEFTTNAQPSPPKNLTVR